jgi:tRNA(Ile2) C34 agmatinyltransferase TiaS
LSAADLKRRPSPTRAANPPVYGVCPRCGRIGAFVWAGAGMYRCPGRSCGRAFPRGEVRDAPPRAAKPRARQADLFEGDGP